MRLHTHLNQGQVYELYTYLRGTMQLGPSVRLHINTHNSRSHHYGHELTLTAYTDELPGGTIDQHGKTMRKRRPVSTGQGQYAATWHEWGWFMAEIFKADPGAKIGNYDGVTSFHAQTGNVFRDTALTSGTVNVHITDAPYWRPNHP